MSEHTPGPWHWVDTYTFGEHLSNTDWSSSNFVNGRIKLVNASGDVVLQEWADYAEDAGLDLNQPDARLIAAAPELLQALIGINEVACYASEENPDAIKDAMLLIGRKARAAIAKAEGKQ